MTRYVAVDFSAWSPPTWSAFAAVCTASVALLALIFAAVQVAQARRLRVEQAQPYLAVYFEQATSGTQHLDLVIRNFGLTAARDIEVRIEPAPTRTSHGAKPTEAVVYPRKISTLVPGQEWRTMFDFAPERKERPDLRNDYVAYISFRGIGRIRRRKAEFNLDWSFFYDRLSVRTLGLNEIARSVKDMQKTLKSWSFGRSSGLMIYGRDAAEEEARRRQSRQEEKEAYDRLMQEIEFVPDPGGEDGDDEKQ